MGGDSFQPSLLDYSGHGPVPVLATPDVAAYLGSRPQQLTNFFGTFQVRVVGTLDHALIPDGGGFLMVSRAALADLPTPQGGPVLAPTTLLLSGPVNGNALRAVTARTEGPVSVEVQVRSEVLAALDKSSPQQTGGTDLYGWTVAAAALLSVLAILLSLLQAAPGRATLLARLRTMGLTPGQGYRLIMLEALPQLVLGVLAGRRWGWRRSRCSARRWTCPRWSARPRAEPGRLDRPGRTEGRAAADLGPALGLLLLGAAVVPPRRRWSANVRSVPS
ncbi:hypothetical protein GXW82_25990 [Streptacidiphilus sp. 4-A2]|nr:hypothetical protein [Streptacidiphilus sp. 4-A2]